LINQTLDLALLSVTLCLKFGINQLPVHADLEASPVRRDKRHRFDQMLELFEQVICQANGPVGIMSDCAVNDLYLEHEPSQKWNIIAENEVINRSLLENYNMPPSKTRH
jgi:hypothetical protein